MYIDFHCHALLSKRKGFDPRGIDEYALFAQHYPTFFRDDFLRPPRLDAVCLTEHVHAPAYEDVLGYLERAMEARPPGVYFYRDVFFLAGAEVGIHERVGEADYYGDAIVLAPPETLLRIREAVLERAASRPPLRLPGGGAKPDTMVGVEDLRGILGRPDDDGPGSRGPAPSNVLGAAHLFRRKSVGGRPLAELPPDRLLRFDYIETNGKDCDGHRGVVELCRRLRMWYLAGSDAHTTVQVGVACHHFPPVHVNRSNLSLSTIARAVRGFLGDSIYDPNARFRIAFASFRKAYRMGAFDPAGSGVAP